MSRYYQLIIQVEYLQSCIGLEEMLEVGSEMKLLDG